MNDAAAVNLGRNIQEVREARGLSQHQMARIADMPRATWANLESGAANPTLSVLVKVAHALQVRLEELIEPLAGPAASTRRPRYPRASAAR